MQTFLYSGNLSLLKTILCDFGKIGPVYSKCCIEMIVESMTRVDTSYFFLGFIY